MRFGPPRGHRGLVQLLEGRHAGHQIPVLIGWTAGSVPAGTREAHGGAAQETRWRLGSEGGLKVSLPGFIHRRGDLGPFPVPEGIGERAARETHGPRVAAGAPRANAM